MRFSIAQKVNLLSVGIILILGIFLGSYFINHETTVLHFELNERVNVLLSNLALNLEYPVLVRNQNAIAQLGKVILSQKDIIFCRIVDNDSNLLYQEGLEQKRPIENFAAAIVTKKIPEGTDEELIFGVQEKVVEEEIGKVQLAVSLSELNRKIGSLKRTVIIVVVAVITSASFASYSLLKSILGRPIFQLVNATKELPEENLTIRFR